jgi:SAM-dependent methyltransferase
MPAAMGHQETYRQNQDYADFLEQWDSGFYAKYIDALMPPRSGARVLDVGCGVGKVVGRLTEAGFEAHGVDVSEPNLERARKRCRHCQLYDGRRLPYPDAHFAAVGALNVLEHVEEPESFIAELARVAEPGALLVLSSPNFFRVLGFRDYHPKMRGLANKWRNLCRLLAKRRQMRTAPNSVRFDRMTPIQRSRSRRTTTPSWPLTPSRCGSFLSATVAGWNGSNAPTVTWRARSIFCLNLTPLRYGMFNAFLVARRMR